MSALTVNLLFALSLWLVVLLSGILPFLKRKKHAHHHDFSFGETIATGIFLGAALMHIIPDSTILFMRLGTKYPISYLITGLTFLFFLWLLYILFQLN
jgi:hypothetical protein